MISEGGWGDGAKNIRRQHKLTGLSLLFPMLSKNAFKKGFFQSFKYEAVIVEINACPNSGYSNLVRHNGILNLSDTQKNFCNCLEEFGKVKTLDLEENNFILKPLFLA